MVVEDRTRRRLYCLFAIARAIGAIICTLVKRELLPSVPYSETAMFSAVTGLLVYCTALKPQYLFTGYYRSVMKWSRDYTDEKLTKLFRTPGNQFLSCAEVGLHQDSCAYHSVRDFIQSVPPFAKLYFTIHMAPIIFFQHKQFVKRFVLPNTGMGIETILLVEWILLLWHSRITFQKLWKAKQIFANLMP